MSSPILTEVSATVDPGRADELVASFGALTEGPVPPGLLRTELVQGDDDVWCVLTLWRDREALDAMRASTEPAAPQLFRQVGARPAVRILRVVDSL
jgi:heme-degrading monooxygenase HmoA